MNEASQSACLVVGRAGMDLYPEPAGRKIAEAESFSTALGGSAANIAAGLCRMGVEASLMTALSDDPVGQFCKAQLASFGVDLSLVRQSRAGTRTSLALSEVRLADHETLIYRNDAADFDIDLGVLDELDLNRYHAIVLTGTALARAPSRDVVFALLDRAQAGNVDVVLDIDYRPYSWASLDDASRICLEVARRCRIVIGNDEEFAVLRGAVAPDPDHARSLLRDGVALCVYKMGREGAITFEQSREIHTGIFPVDALKPVGAGDAFMAAFLAGYYGGLGLEQSLIRGSAAAALVVTKVGCAAAIPTILELDAFCAAHAMVPALSVIEKA